MTNRQIAPIQAQPAARSGGTVYVSFLSSIDDASARALMSACAELLGNFRPETIYLCISSPGGSVAAGIALYSYLSALPVKLVTHNMGSVDSIATAIFMAGAERYACPHSTFLFHGVAMNPQPGMALNASRLRELLSSLSQDEAKIATVVTSRSSLSLDEINAFFAQGESKSPEFAQQKGIIHGTRDLKIPHGAPIVTLK